MSRNRTRARMAPLVAISLLSVWLLLPGAPAGAQPASGDILLSDNMENPDTGVLPAQSSDPARRRIGYVGGEYVIEKLAAAEPESGVLLPGDYSDAALTIDARLAGDTNGRHIIMLCRRDRERGVGYALLFDPNDGEYRLLRTDDDRGVQLDGGFSTAFRSGGATNRLELSCAGSTISAAVNGALAVSVEDATYRQGQLAIGVGVWSAFLPATAEARFDNLVARRVAPGATAGGAPVASAAPATPPASPPAAQPSGEDILLSDDMESPDTGVLPELSAAVGSVGYIGGEYRLRKADPEARGVILARLPGRFTDASLTIDARLVGETADRFVLTACREDPDRNVGYQFAIVPQTGAYGLFRSDEDRLVTLASGRSAAILRDAATNRIELTCAGSTLSAAVNGARVASAEDATYREGRMFIGVTVSTDALPATVEARLDNLVVRRVAPGAQAGGTGTPPPATQAPPATGQPAAGQPPPATAPPTAQPAGVLPVPGTRFVGFDEQNLIRIEFVVSQDGTSVEGTLSAEQDIPCGFNRLRAGFRFAFRMRIQPDGTMSATAESPSGEIITLDARFLSPTEVQGGWRINHIGLQCETGLIPFIARAV